MEIFDEYLSSSAEMEINLAHPVKLAIQTQLSDPNSIIKNDFYNNAQREIFYLMKRDIFVRFLEDPLFEER